ncbi:Y-family DNA polymerase [Candidatus Odyssella thessalonicensis]|uniref:Y-family DNA polymerase n=1 Tax=Candidatus Odyssella thessalonicensis TaxID=84647 RepID=UPI000225BEAE|nr:Y-family DNA polymerase [Candidatus Odyssella thessalonicensis]
MIGLIDCNNFFVSCERVFRPDLKNKPVIVLSNNDGCVIARSNEVKALGIPMGVPLFKIKHLVEQHNITLFSSNFSLYGDLSVRVMHTLGNLVPSLEIYSVDEAFLDLAGIEDIILFGQKIRHTVEQHIGIPTSLGIASTKTLAKIANYYAKKDALYKGVCLLQSESDVISALMDLPVNEIWGIGRKITESLLRLRIRTAWDLYQVDRAWMRQKYTVTGERLWMELHGIPCRHIEEVAANKKSIQVTRSFATAISTLEELKQVIAGYASRAGEKLRKTQQRTRTLMVYLRTNKFRPQDPQVYRTGSLTLPFPVYDNLSLTTAACKILEQIFEPGYKYYKAGVMLMDFSALDTIQLDLFTSSLTPQQEEKTLNLSKAMDSINHRFGKSTIVHGSCGLNLHWKDRKQRVSPAYTTRWEDLPLVK